MVTLKEDVFIPVPFEKLSAWVDNFEEEFVKWSPYHLECELLDGEVRPGARMRFYEIVMGMDYDVAGTITVCEKDDSHFKFSFMSDKKTAVITFEGERRDDGCLFSHTEEFGMRMPIIGPIVNFLIFKVFYRKKADWRVIRDDMVLDNRYLAEILTTGSYPARIPVEQLKG